MSTINGAVARAVADVAEGQLLASVEITAANAQPAFAFYSRWQGPEWRFHSIQLLVLHGTTISSMTSFVTPALASVFGLPAVLPAKGDIGEDAVRL